MQYLLAGRACFGQAVQRDQGGGFYDAVNCLLLLLLIFLVILFLIVILILIWLAWAAAAATHPSRRDRLGLRLGRRARERQRLRAGWALLRPSLPSRMF